MSLLASMFARLRRVDWSAGAELAVLAAVLAIAALVSYTHLRDVWIAAGSPWPELGPLLVDGLFAAAWLRMRRRRRQGEAVGLLAWSALGLALAATVAGNLAAAWVAGHTDALAYVVAAWPAVAFALVWELVTGHGRKPAVLATAPTVRDEDEADEVEPEPDLDPDPMLTRARALIAKGAGRPTLVKELAVTDYRARQLVEQAKGTTNGATVR